MDDDGPLAKGLRPTLGCAGSGEFVPPDWRLADTISPEDYAGKGREFAGHGTVNHSINEYVRGGFWHTNTVENYFSIFKRGIIGVYQHVSQKHLRRYLGEYDFRYNEREALSVSDAEHTEKSIPGIVGKRLTYRRTGEAGHV